jgi:hypothetical protein
LLQGATKTFIPFCWLDGASPAVCPLVKFMLPYVANAGFSTGSQALPTPPCNLFMNT